MTQQVLNSKLVLILVTLVNFTKWSQFGNVKRIFFLPGTNKQISTLLNQNTS
jgi:hypothetical protein